jgi:hypothetical protein
MNAVAVGDMFREGQQLPHLQEFNTTDVDVPLVGDMQSAVDLFNRWSLWIGDGDADRIVQSCPALQSLGSLAVCGGLPHTQLLPLLQLSALTELSIGGAGCTDIVAEKVLAKMTGGARNSTVG